MKKLTVPQHFISVFISSRDMIQSSLFVSSIQILFSLDESNIGLSCLLNSSFKLLKGGSNSVDLE